MECVDPRSGRRGGKVIYFPSHGKEDEEDEYAASGGRGGWKENKKKNNERRKGKGEEKMVKSIKLM